MATGFETLYPLMAATFGAGLVSAGGLIIGRKLGLTPAQSQYVDTLQGLNDVLMRKTEVLQKELDEQKAHIVELEVALQLHKELVAELRQENFELRQEKSVKRRQQTYDYSEEDHSA